MTREEAIEAIKCNWPDSRYTILREALDMAISALREQDVADKDVGNNEPLTLDELRQMYGEPVWLVGLDRGNLWARIEGMDSLAIRFSLFGSFERFCFRTKSYGVRVWAYRQKPEEESHQ